MYFFSDVMCTKPQTNEINGSNLNLTLNNLDINMTKSVHGYAAHSATTSLTPFQFQRRDSRNNDVEIEIL